MNSGVYAIVNKANGKLYVGSSIDLKKRESDHFKDFAKGEAINRHLKYAVLKYGIENFEFIVLEYCENLLEREQYYWEIHKDNCYNCYKPNLDPRELSRILTGRHFDEEHRSNLSKASKKRWAEREHPLKGRKHKESSKAKMSLSAKKRGRTAGKWSSEEAKEIRRRFMTGEMIMKISSDLNAHRKNIGSICNCKSYLEEEAFPKGYKEWFDGVLEARKRGERPTKRGWKHSDEFIEKFRKSVSGPRKSPRKSTRKLSDQQVREIRKMRKDGEKLREIAEKFEVSSQLISAICKGVRYGDII
jgi:group I intron endonuclease